MFTIPLDVPSNYRKTFTKNYTAITKNTDRLFLFAADHKIEKLHPINPEDLFVIADSMHIGAFATHLGLIARYGMLYKNINYIVKLNGKTDIVKTEQKDPQSSALWSINQIIRFKKESGLAIRGVGYTVYLGSEYESSMLAEAAQIINQAHQHGLVAILWLYPRGKAINDDNDVHAVAGAAGVAVSLGADFVKIKIPHVVNAISSAVLLKQVVASAGNTKVICAGGDQQEIATLLSGLHEYLHTAHIAGAAIGRNIFERNFTHAMKVTEAIAGLIYQNCSLEQAIKIANE